MNYDTNSISMNIDIGKKKYTKKIKKKKIYFFLLNCILSIFYFRSYSSFFSGKKKRGGPRKRGSLQNKGFFRFDSRLFNRWIEVYSG